MRRLYTSALILTFLLMADSARAGIVICWESREASRACLAEQPGFWVSVWEAVVRWLGVG